jgi:hypothetical protein
MNLEQAIAAMREGKKVRTKKFNKESYICCNPEERIINENGNYCYLHIKDLDAEYELYKDPNEIKVGDYVQVEYFKDKYKLEVMFVNDRFIDVRCEDLDIATCLPKKHCKKLPVEFVGSSELEYKAGDKVWAKCIIKEKLDSNCYLVMTTHNVKRSGPDYTAAYLYELKPRGDNE